MPVPERPKIYHILHIDRLRSVIAEGLLCDEQISQRNNAGTVIGISGIKQRRLTELRLNSYPDLYIGQCVPFYFCPRSVMLYVIHCGDHQNLGYHDGQEPVLHLEADLYTVMNWAEQNQQRWAFTLSNAGAFYVEDRCQREHLNELNWEAINALWWNNGLKESKQAEFLVERHFPWHLVERIGVHSRAIYQQVANILPPDGHRPPIEVKGEWYY
ncbi:DUF4433 domain-containing protein [Salmonella enterica]|uniref:DUF4433 domain-containing protein n=1 Tax=Salmonella enterica TaxID=28901 RepID=A0A624MHJ9_SALER|nr:DUF4433 domain-containing protein [Salmonella enterica]EBF9516837.1 DUF4433 domain-containing protein [Salmonella enterica subsp. enterica serovar Kingston]EBW4446194.1 DUF4433 domain-containing protein [Salmonella enterica subsp. enterica serovar Arechavaleta]ECK7274233.1 DUF4433 domain-containing protein [Salmonella enterica subsp. enterica serovar Budapest]EBG1461538.1 DUF4433 domain-containing protein [Salmonella enterica]